MQSSLSLLQPGETRFGTAFISMQRCFQMASQLQQLAVSSDWTQAVSRMKPTEKQTAATIKARITDDTFWDEVNVVLSVAEPIYKLLRKCDQPVATVGKVYYGMSKILSTFKDNSNSQLDDDVCEDVAQLVQQRWNYMHSPIHGAAYLLDPEYWDVGNKDAHCTTDLHDIMDKMLSAEEAALARAQYAKFVAKEGLFGIRGRAVADASRIPAHQWWEQYGRDCIELQRVAVRVLSQVSSASDCERNWSAYDFIHNKKRNKLAPARARDLVYVFSNTKLLERADSIDNEEAFAGWSTEEEGEEEEGAMELDNSEEEDGVL